MYIYLITNLVNNKIYIGQSTKPFDETLSYYGSGKKIKRAIKKYGKENFTKRIIDICPNQDLLDKMEIHWINFFNARNPKIGYNIAKGGATNFGKGKGFKQSKKHIENQKASYHSRPLEKCPYCDFETRNSGCLNQHVKTFCKNNTNQIKREILKCSYCDYYTIYGIRFKNHLEMCEFNPINMGKVEHLRCPHCKIVPKTKTAATRFHFDNCKHKCGYISNPKIIICPNCGEKGKFPSIYKNHFNNCKHKII